MRGSDTPEKNKHILLRLSISGWYIYLSRRAMKFRRPCSDDTVATCRRYCIAGLNLYISRRGMQIRHNGQYHSKTVKRNRHARMDLTGKCCEGCGRKQQWCCVWHMLPVGAPGRNEVANIRVLCCECRNEARKRGYFAPHIAQKGVVDL